MKSTRRLALACATLAATLPQGSSGADLYWDSNGGTSGTGGSGTWNSTSTTTWRSGSDTGALGGWTSTTDTAVLGDTGGTITLGSAITAAGITVLSNASAAYTITSSATNLLTLGTSAPILVPSGKTLNFTGPAAGSILGGNTTPVFQGGGTINLTGTNRVYVGILRATGSGTLLVVNGTNALDNNSASTGLESLNGAVVRINGTNNYRRGATLDGGTLECGNIRSLQAQVNNILTINGTNTKRSVVANSMSAGNLGGLAGNGSTARTATVNATNDPGGIDLEYQAGWRNGTLNKVGAGTMLITSTSTFNRNDNYTAAHTTSYALSVNAGTVINEGTVMSPTAVTSTGLLRSGASTGVFDQIDVNGGIFELSRTTGLFNDSFVHSTDKGDINLNGGTLRYASGFTTDASSLLGPLGASGGTVNTNGNDVTFASALSGSGAFTKQGAGSLTLSTTSSHTGNTTVAGGTLLVDGNIATSALTTVNASAVLGGSGTLGATTVTGTHSPGNSPGVQTVAGDLTYNAGATLIWELIANSTSGRGTTFDGIDVTGAGNLAFAGATTLDLDFALAGSAVRWSDTLWDQSLTGTNGWKVFDLGTGAISGLTNLTIATEDWTDGSGATLSSVRPGSIFTLVSDGNDLYLNFTNPSAIPEPGSLFGLGLLLGAPTLLRRRRMA